MKDKYGLAGVDEMEFRGPLVVPPDGYVEQDYEKEASEAKALAEDFKVVMRCNGLEPKPEVLDDVLRKYKILVASAENAVRAYVRAGVEMPKGNSNV